MQWRLRMSTSYTRAANSRKGAYVPFCLHQRRSMLDAANKSLGGRLSEVGIVLQGS